jgi:hypothetical protein
VSNRPGGDSPSWGLGVCSTAREAWGNRVVKPGNWLSLGQRNDENLLQALQMRAQRLGSPALGINGKAAGPSVIYYPDHHLPPTP